MIDITGVARDGAAAMRMIPPLTLLALLAACGGETAHPVAEVSQPIARPVHHGLHGDSVMAGVIGADADALIRQFGTPRLDIRDGDARKLQWSGSACILDAYLYPGDHGGRATATFVDARRGDGRDVDRTACVTALRKN